MYSDTMFSSMKGIRKDRCAQVFVTDFKWSSFHPMKLKSQAGEALQTIVETVGIPAHVVTDYAKKKWKALGRKLSVNTTSSSQPQNPTALGRTGRRT